MAQGLNRTESDGIQLSLGELECRHRACQWNLVGFDQHMHVIGHQDKRITPEMIPPPVPLQALEIGVIIRRLMKGGGPAVAADNDVVGRRGSPRAVCEPSRDPIRTHTHKSILMPDPISYASNAGGYLSAISFCWNVFYYSKVNGDGRVNGRILRMPGILNSAASASLATGTFGTRSPRSLEAPQA